MCICIYTLSFPVTICLSLGVGKGHGVSIHVQLKCASVSLKVRFSHSNSKILKFPAEKTQASFQREKCAKNQWFHRESAWTTCDFRVTKKKYSSIVNLFSSQYVHSQHYYWSGGPWTCKSLSGKREKGHSGPKLKSMVLRSQGPRSPMNHILFLSF